MNTLGLISAIAAPILAMLLGWVLSRRKSGAEVRKLTAEAVAVEIQNAGKVIEFWKRTAEDLTEKLEKASAKIDILMQKLQDSIEENEKLMQKLQDSIEENEKLEKKIGELEKQLQS